MSAATMKRRGREIAGTTSVLPVEAAAALHAHQARRERNIGAQLRSAISVWSRVETARGLWFRRGIQSGEEDAALDLRARDGDW